MVGETDELDINSINRILGRVRRSCALHRRPFGAISVPGRARFLGVVQFAGGEKRRIRNRPAALGRDLGRRLFAAEVNSTGVPAP
jgi:hypothetical protein